MFSNSESLETFETRQLLQALKIELSSTRHSLYYENMIDTMLKMLRFGLAEDDLKLMAASLHEQYKTLKLFAPYKDFRKVCMFGSARTPKDDPDYHMAESFAQEMTRRGFMIITGGGPGIMEAGNKGSDAGNSFGLNINLPFEQDANPFIKNSAKHMYFKYFFNRKLAFIRESDATVLFPGGYGTHDEGFELLTLIQNGRSRPRPVILMANPESTYWDQWEAFIHDQLLGRKLISPADTSLFKISKSVPEAIGLIEQFYRVFHSIKYLHNDCIIRLNGQLSEQTINTLNHDFLDIIKEGQFKQVPGIESGYDEGKYGHLFCLVFPFFKVKFGRLIQLIDFINTQDMLPAKED